jgi:hypothetical protein
MACRFAARCCAFALTAAVACLLPTCLPLMAPLGLHVTLQPYLIEGFLEPRASYWRWSVTADPMKQKKSAGAALTTTDRKKDAVRPKGDDGSQASRCFRS